MGKMNKLWLANFKRRLRNSKVVVKKSKKNLKLNAGPEQDLKRLEVMSHVKLKNFPKDLKKLLLTPKLKLKSQRDVKVKWPRSDEILKNLLLTMNQPFQTSKRKKLTKPQA